jgi:hypothetical protein
MSRERYVFVEADTAESATNWVRIRLEELRYEFYDGFNVDPDRTVRVKDLPRDVIDRAACNVQKEADLIKEQIDVFKPDGNKDMLGWLHIRYGEILQEELCRDMPYFNIECWDWSVPEDRNEARPWFAVHVTFY